MNAQEQFWRGEFGNAYSQRSPGDVVANYRFFELVLDRIFEDAQVLNSICELGCGVGANLKALRQHLPSVQLAGVEINEAAAAQAWAHGEIYRSSLLDWRPPKQWELAFTKGVLIHIAPDDLPKAYDALYQASSRYVVVAEYYNPTPAEVPYRGHAGRLWKRDFAGEMLDRYPLELVSYGFAYHRDIDTPQDDLTWFLMEKR